MTRLNHTHAVTHNGAHQFDIACAIDCTVEFNGEEPALVIDGVYFSDEHERFTVLAARGPAWMRELGAVIANEVQDDPDFLARAFELAGYTYRSRGSNDPEATWVEAA